MRVDDKDSHGWSRIQKANGTPTMVNQPERTTGYLICRFDYVLANEITYPAGRFSQTWLIPIATKLDPRRYPPVHPIRLHLRQEPAMSKNHHMSDELEA